MQRPRRPRISLGRMLAAVLAAGVLAWMVSPLVSMSLNPAPPPPWPTNSWKQESSVGLTDSASLDVALDQIIDKAQRGVKLTPTEMSTLRGIGPGAHMLRFLRKPSIPDPELARLVYLHPDFLEARYLHHFPREWIGLNSRVMTSIAARRLRRNEALDEVDLQCLRYAFGGEVSQALGKCPVPDRELIRHLKANPELVEAFLDALPPQRGDSFFAPPPEWPSRLDAEELRQINALAIAMEDWNVGVEELRDPAIARTKRFPFTWADFDRARRLFGKYFARMKGRPQLDEREFLRVFKRDREIFERAAKIDF